MIVTKRVTFRFWAGSLLGTRQLADYHQAASVRAYSEAVRDALRQAFPGASVSVQAIESSPINLPHTILASADGRTGTPEAKRVVAVAGQVFREGSWLVHRESGE